MFWRRTMRHKFGLLFYICVIVHLIDAQANSTDSTTDQQSGGSESCRDSSGLCVRTCCPEGENVLGTTCGPKTIEWQPSFLGDSSTHQLDIVSGFIPPCEFGYKLTTFSDTVDPSTRYTLTPENKLMVETSDGTQDLAYDYCFYNVEYAGLLYEGVQSCRRIAVPQVPSLPRVADVISVPLHKCCPSDQSIGVEYREVDGEEMQHFTCMDKPFPWHPTVLEGDPTTLAHIPENKMDVQNSGEFHCPGKTSEEYILSSDTEHANFLLPNGSLLLSNFQVTLKPGSFCQDQFSSSGSPSPIVKACYGMGEEVAKDEFEEHCPEGNICALKCCSPGFMLYYGRCVPTVIEWSPTFYEGRRPVDPPARHRIIHGGAACDESGDSFIFSRRLSPEDTPFLQINGSVIIPGINLTFQPHECCIDNERYVTESREFDIAEMAVCCHERDIEAEIRGIVASVLLTISAVFLFIMLAIYMLVPKLRNVHGKCLMSHAAALFVAFFLTAFNQFQGVSLGPSCDLLGLLLYYSFLAALFWLNVMSFDIWWTFANLRTRQPSERSQRNRFLRHSAYAWGAPLLMTAILAFLNYGPDSLLPPDALLRPDLGRRRCFLSDKKVQLYYFYVPIFIVTGVNIILFVMTAYVLFTTERSTQKILKRKRTARDRLKVYVNLFIIMEVSWIAECLSTQVGHERYWYFTDIINASQGTLIFLLFISRKSTRQTIADRFRELFPCCGKQKSADICQNAANGAAKGQARANVSSQTKTTNASSSSALASQGAIKPADDALAMHKMEAGAGAGAAAAGAGAAGATGAAVEASALEGDTAAARTSPERATGDPAEEGFDNDVFVEESEDM